MKCKRCGYRMVTLYIHINRSDIKKKWIPVVWYCVDCGKLGGRMPDYRSSYKKKLLDNVGNLKGDKHQYTKGTSEYCGFPMVKLYRNSNRKHERGWISEFLFCIKCDRVVKRVL